MSLEAAYKSLLASVKDLTEIAHMINEDHGIFMGQVRANAARIDAVEKELERLARLIPAAGAPCADRPLAETQTQSARCADTPSR